MYVTLTSSFKPKAPFDDEDVLRIIRKKEQDDDIEPLLLDHDLIEIGEDLVTLNLSDAEYDGDDLDLIKREWKIVVEEFADFSGGPAKVELGIDDEDDGHSDETYYLGPEKLVLAQEIRDLEDERDQIEERIAEKRRALREADLPAPDVR